MLKSRYVGENSSHNSENFKRWMKQRVFDNKRFFSSKESRSIDLKSEIKATIDLKTQLLSFCIPLYILILILMPDWPSVFRIKIRFREF